MEACIKDHIVDHLERNALIKPSQHGFMRRKSCTTNLLEFLEKVTSEIDQGNAMDVVYLDFSKAFDKVETGVLLHKLKESKVLEKVGIWFRQ